VTRKSDTAARLGGDEFALLIENLEGPSAAEEFADRVITAFAKSFELSAGSVLAGATIGVATTEDSRDVDELLRHADLSLYAAKAQGKRRWHRYTPALSAAMVKRRQMQQNLEESLVASDFALAYQPIADLTSGAIRGFEALVRWRHPEQGEVPPAEFIGLAEETGLIIPLGSWILRRAIAETAQWHGVDPDQRPDISVIVSPRQFRDSGFFHGLRRCLDETGFAPSALTLELSHSSLLRRDERIPSDLEQLRNLGVRLSIRAIGAGYFSPSYLAELPINALKINKFLLGTLTDSHARKFTELVIDFADARGVQVIAEGIETYEQRTLLTEMGCRLGQGHQLAAPMGRSAAEELLMSDRRL
jgi:EAL domain-containing protein (putative c-di-GMP-specific phosphodiesterase class I)